MVINKNFSPCFAIGVGTKNKKKEWLEVFYPVLCQKISEEFIKEIAEILDEKPKNFSKEISFNIFYLKIRPFLRSHLSKEDLSKLTLIEGRTEYTSIVLTLLKEDKNTWNNFTKFVLGKTVIVISVLVLMVLSLL